MANDLTQFLLQYLFVLFACFGFYLLGSFLLRFFPLYLATENNRWLHSYAIIVLGIVITVLIYSIALAKGKTINILILPILIGLFLSKKKVPISSNKQPFFRNWPSAFLLAAPLFFLLLFHLLPESEYKQSDALRYLQISQSFNNFGQENNFGGMSLFGKPFVGTVPYHYFEYWLNAILLKCIGSSLPGIKTLRFVCYGIISTGGLLGLFALAESLIKAPITFFQKITCICFIFYLPNFLDYIHFLKPILIYPFENNILERPNLRIVYLFLPGIFITIGKQEYKWQSLFWIVCAMVSTLVNFVILLPSIILYSLIAILNKKNKQYAVFLLIGSFLIGILYLLFYHFTSSNIKVTPKELTKNDILAYYLRHWKIVIFSSTTSIFYGLFMSLVLLFFIKKIKPTYLLLVLKAQQSLILFTVILIFCAMIISRALNFMDNSYQFAFLGYTSGGLLFLILLLTLNSIFKIKNWAYCIIALAFILSYILPRFFLQPHKNKDIYSQNASYTYGGNTFSNEYLQKLSSAFAAGAKVTGAFWADAKFYDSIPQYSSRNPNVYSLPSAYILAGKLQSNYEICLSDSASIMYGLDTTQKISYDYVKSSILYSPFYSFQQQENVNERRLSFIKKYKLQYLILTKNADTSIINKLTVLKYFQDDVTGERFYVIYK